MSGYMFISYLLALLLAAHLLFILAIHMYFESKNLFIAKNITTIANIPGHKKTCSSAQL